LLSRGTCAARARELKTTASWRRERSDRGFHCRRIRESPPAPHPTVVATMLPPRAFVKILPEGRNGGLPELSRRRETVVSALAQKGWVAQAHVCARARFARTHLPTRTRERGKGGAAAPRTRERGKGGAAAPRTRERGKGGAAAPLRNTGRCALTSRKNGSPVPATFSLAPQPVFQSNASRRCANPRTVKSQLSACRGPKFIESKGWGATLLPRG